MTDGLDRILALVAAGELSPEDAEPLVVAATVGPPSASTSDPANDPDAARTWTSPTAAARAVRITVTDGGQAVVNLRIPMSLASLAGSVIPGLADTQVARLQQALRDGEVGTIIDVRDDQGSGVLITTE